MKVATVIAEIGCNHKGDLEIAKEMIRTAKEICKADVAKFQKRTPKELLTDEQYNEPHPTPYNAYGENYGAHREFLEFSIEQHKELKEYSESIGIMYSTSVWDMTSAREVVELNPAFIKIPSACNNYTELIEYLCTDYKGEIHISLGMTTKEEEKELVDLIEKNGRLGDLVLYSCTSGYPVPDEDVCLLEISRLKEAYDGRVKAIGFSGHHNGIAIDVAAFTLGAEYIERHFTLDRTWKGTDHAASLEPDGLRRVVRDIKTVSDALTYKSSELLEIELPQRDKLKWKKVNGG